MSQAPSTSAAAGPIVVDRPAPRIVRIALNRPERRNALDPELRERFHDAIAEALADASARALVITGQGGSFSAGGDLSTLSGIDAKAARARLHAGHALVRRLIHAEKPIVAAVEGYAMGAGAGVALCADTIVVGKGATIGFPFLKVGLMSDYGVAYSLACRIGIARARDALLYARNFRGEEAVAIGLADVLVEDSEVQSTALERATALAEMPPSALGLMKRQFALLPAGLDAALELEALGQPGCLVGEEFREGVAAFREKRRPKF